VFLPPNIKLRQHRIDLRGRQFGRQLRSGPHCFGFSQVSRDGIPQVSRGLAHPDTIAASVQFSQDHGGIGVPFFGRLAKSVSRGSVILGNAKTVKMQDA
jgi:hypothetical protein